jgi:ABC-type transporter Mla subunit MlaD
VVKEDFTNKAIMAELTRMKRVVEKLLKDSTDTKASQTATAALLKDQDKKVSTLATAVSETGSRANNLSSQVETFRTGVNSKLDEILSALNGAGASRQRGNSFDNTPPRPPGAGGGNGGEGPSRNGGRGMSRATNSLS